jgi:hypothetical protein
VKFVPVAVKVKAAEPAVTEAGLIDERVGVTTPLKPPQPEKNIARNGSTNRMRRLNTLMGDSAFLKITGSLVNNRSRVNNFDAPFCKMVVKTVASAGGNPTNRIRPASHKHRCLFWIPLGP